LEEDLIEIAQKIRIDTEVMLAKQKTAFVKRGVFKSAKQKDLGLAALSKTVKSVFRQGAEK